MKIEMRPVGEVIPYDKNPRKNLEAVDAVCASLKEFGFRQPIVVDAAGVIVVGHTRWMAAKKLGLKTVPVHVAADLTPEQAKAYRIADNQTATIASWDMDMLAIEIAELGDAGFDLDVLGFDGDELTEIMAPKANAGETDPDDVPLPPDAAISVKGDIWVLGNHRLMCGDSSKPEDLDRLLDGERIHLVNTDPPYNVKVSPRTNNAYMGGDRRGMPSPAQGIASGTWKVGKVEKEGSSHRSDGKVCTDKQMRARDRPLANDFMTDEAFEAILLAWFGNLGRVLIPGGAFYIWGGYANCANYPPAMKASGLYFAQAIIWDKQHPVLTRKDFMGAHEWAFYGWREGAGHNFYGPNNATDLWHVKKVNPQSMVHLTEKPVELARLAIEYSSRPGENVLDLFGGSGSTLIGCEMTGRRGFLMELDELYCDVIVNRWEKFTGKKAVRIPPGAATPPAQAAAGEAPAQTPPEAPSPQKAKGGPKRGTKKTPATAAGV